MSISESSARNQYVATFFANFMALGHGITCGWPSPNMPILSSENTPLPSGKLDDDEISMIAAIMSIGAIFGTIFYACMIERIGRKGPLVMLAVPSIAGWIMTLFAQNPYYLYAARFSNGFCGGGVFVVVPTFIAEIATDNIRGLLGSTLVFSCNIGILLAFTFGEYCDYTFTPIFVIIMCAVFISGAYFLPETPAFLLKNYQIEKAEESLRFYRNVKMNTKQDKELISFEMNKLQNTTGVTEKKLNSVEQKLQWSDFTAPASRRALKISFALVALNQFCGLFAMLNYTATIFKESGSEMTPNVSAIVVGIIQLLGSYVSTVLVERAGRKLLISVSAFGTSFGLLCLGTYIYLKTLGVNVEQFSWVPISSFSFGIFVGSWGVLTLPFLVMSELIPEKIRSFGISLSMCLLSVFAFLLVKYFPLISGVLGMHGSFFLFAVCSLVGGLFVLFCMPETKGKSFEEIMRTLS